MSCRFPENFWEKKHVLNPLKVSILSSILFICSYIPNQKQVSMKSAPKPSYLSRRQWLYFKSNSTQQFISKIFRTPTMCKTLRKKKMGLAFQKHSIYWEFQSHPKSPPHFPSRTQIKGYDIKEHRMCAMETQRETVLLAGEEMSFTLDIRWGIE